MTELSAGLEVIDLAEIATLDEKKSKARKTTIDMKRRDFETWFRLNTTFGVCENPNCLDDRPKKVEEGNAMTALVDGKRMCRICFLGGFNL